MKKRIKKTYINKILNQKNEWLSEKESLEALIQLGKKAQEYKLNN